MTTTTAPTYAPFPPKTSQVSLPNGESSGTIVGVSSDGPATFTLYNAAGAVMTKASYPGAFDVPVSLAFSGGAMTVTQTTPSSIYFTFA
jgi:hypothetical protein